MSLKDIFYRTLKGFSNALQMSINSLSKGVKLKDLLKGFERLLEGLSNVVKGVKRLLNGLFKVFTRPLRAL